MPIVSVPELDENYSLARRLGHRSLLTGELAEYVIDNRGHLAGHLLTHGRVSAVASLVRTQRARGARWPFIVKQFGPSLAPGRLTNATSTGAASSARCRRRTGSPAAS